MGASLERGGTSYQDLYAQWERDSWSAEAIDFSVDRRHWRERLDDIQRTSALWNGAMFLHGVEGLARALPAAYQATLGTQQNVCVAAHIADEARHKVFLLRWLRAVAGIGGGGAAAALDELEDQLTWGFRQIFGELEEAAAELGRKADDRGALARLLAVSNVMIEGMLAIPGQHFFHRYVGVNGIMPGFSAGAAAVARDVSRHVGFGMKLLKETIDRYPEARQATIDTWNRALPWTVGVFVPPGLDRSYVECFDFTLPEIYAAGLRSFEGAMGHLGIRPEELTLLRRDDRSLSYDERAARLLVLIEAGVLGDDRREPHLNQEALEILFDAMARSVDLETARSLGGPIEWRFTDSEPWHIVVVDDHAEAKPGAAGEAALVLELSSADWARIAVGRADARWALVKRRLRVHGPWPAKTKLPKLFT